MVQTTSQKTASGGFQAHLFKDLFELEARNFWFKNRNRLLLHFMENFAKSSGRFVEIGCGTGFVISAIKRRFPNLEVFGTELFEEGLSFAKKRVPNATLIQMDAKNISYENYFDVVGIFDVLEHIDEDELVLNQLHKALTPDGRIFITVPQHPSMWSQIDDLAHHVRRYSRDDLLEKLRRANFTPIHVTSFMTLLLPVMCLSRWLNKRKANYDPMSEFNIPRWLNQALELVLRVELALIKIGVQFPVGGSLFVVARRTGEIY